MPATGARRTMRGWAWRRRGFTLLEMLIVVAILGLLATLVFTRLSGEVGQSKVNVTRTQINEVASAVERFNLDVGRYPTEEEGLSVLIEAPAGGLDGWEGPYLGKRVLPTDGWGRELVYESDEAFGFVVRSHGSDGEPGGEGEAADLDNRS